MNTNRAVQITYFLLRVVSGLLFLQAGGMKLFGWFGRIPPEMGGQLPLMSQIGISGVLEFFGGLAIMLGLLTRPVAYWQFHAPNGAWPIQNHSEPAVLLCFIFLYMAARGGGDWNLDALLRRKRGDATNATVKAE